MERKGFILTLPLVDCRAIEKIVKEKPDKYKNRDDFIDNAVQRLLEETRDPISEKTIRMLKKILGIKDYT